MEYLTVFIENNGVTCAETWDGFRIYPDSCLKTISVLLKNKPQARGCIINVFSMPVSQKFVNFQKYNEQSHNSKVIVQEATISTACNN